MTNDNNNDSMLPSLFASAAAGIVARACTHPLDTAKARLQAPSSKYKGPMDTLWRTFSTEGFVGLYRGFGAVLIGGTPGTMLYLCSYDLFKKNLGDCQDNFAIHFVSGMLAETIACIIYVPVDVVKERMQVQQGKGGLLYRNSMDAFTKICQTEGLSGIYKGYAATLASFGPFSALYFMFYERFKHVTRQHLLANNNENDSTSIPSKDNMEIPFPYVVLSSCSAGALASWLTSPLDMAKLRLQIQRGKMASNTGTQAGETYRGVVDCLRYAYREGGFHGLFRGAWARVLHFAPATTITMTCYETFRAHFAKTLLEAR